MEKYIQFTRDKNVVEELIKNNKNAFCLLAIISLRAKRTDNNNFSDLEIGECYLGDYKNYGMTEQEYRTSKKFLEKHKIATFQPTPYGTIAKLISTLVFDINANNEVTDEITPKQRTPNGPLTTKKNIKNIKNDNNNKSNVTLQEQEIRNQVRKKQLLTEAEIDKLIEAWARAYCDKYEWEYNNFIIKSEFNITKFRQKYFVPPPGKIRPKYMWNRYNLKEIERRFETWFNEDYKIPNK